MIDSKFSLGCIISYDGYLDIDAGKKKEQKLNCEGVENMTHQLANEDENN